LPTRLAAAELNYFGNLGRLVIDMTSPEFRPENKSNDLSSNPNRSERFKPIYCGSEIELSKGTEKILKERGHKLLATVSYKLNQFKLSSRYSENEIISEAYDRTLGKVRNGTKIQNLYGWYSTMMLNIVREYSRAERRQGRLRDMISSCCEQGQEHFGEHQPRQNIEQIKKLVGNELNYKILYLRAIEEKSWEEVCWVLIEDGDFKCELSAQFVNRIKQRFSRALKKINKPLS
jgi:hypothetical protein